MAAKYVQQRIEQILDDSAGGAGAGDRSISVIIQMAGPRDAQADDIVRMAAESARRRSMLTSARDLVASLEPARKSGKKESVLSKASISQSVARQVASSGLKAKSRDTLRSEALRHLAPLEKSGLFQKARAIKPGGPSGGRRGAANEPDGGEPRTLWSSNSVVLHVTRDELHRLPSEVDAITNVVVNAKVRLPPVVKLDEEPQEEGTYRDAVWGLEAIKALSSWGLYESWGDDVKVAVLDTGIDEQHPDLNGKLALFAEFDQDGNQVTGAQPHDSDEHGTHCAGIVAGSDASGRWIGVAPNAKIMSGLVLPGGGGTYAQILAGMQWAIDEGADVISMSLGDLTFSPGVASVYTQTILAANRLGIPVVAAIGNDGSQTSGAPGNDFFAYAVGALDHEGRAAGFSGGRTHVIDSSPYISDDALPLVYSKPDVSAPGVAVTSSVPGGKWESWNGTSMATPHVAGAMALLLSATELRDEPQNRRAFLIQEILAGTVDELGESGQDHRYGFGRINVRRAIGEAKYLGY